MHHPASQFEFKWVSVEDNLSSGGSRVKVKDDLRVGGLGVRICDGNYDLDLGLMSKWRREMDDVIWVVFE